MTTINSHADPIAVVNHLTQTARPVIHIPAKVTSIGGYSAHADQKGLVEFVTGMQQWPTEIRVVHGEQKAKQALGAQLHASYKQQNRPDVRITTGGMEDMSEQGGNYDS